VKINGKQKIKKQNKEVIIASAMELFKVYGFKKVSMNEIAERAGVAIGTLYNHFENKNQLIVEVIKKQSMDLFMEFSNVIKSDRPFKEKLEYLIYGKATAAGKYRGEIVQKALDDSPDIRNFIEDFINNRIKQNYIDLFNEGKKLGYIDKSISNETILLYIEVFKRGVLASQDLFAQKRSNIKQLNSLIFYGFVGKR